MGVSNDCYSRDLRRYTLALRMLRLGARPNTIQAWATLSRQRVRSLVRSHRADGSVPNDSIHRGPSPTSLTTLLATPGLRSELTAVAGWCRLLGVLPVERVSNARMRLPNVANAERLCHAFDAFKAMVPHSRLTFEQLVLLVFELAEGKDWSLDHCSNCRAVILVDRSSAARRVCSECRRLRSNQPDAALPAVGRAADDDPAASTDLQQSLF